MNNSTALKEIVRDGSKDKGFFTHAPSMMNPYEKSTLYRLAKHYYDASGVIIDAGIFAGASTVCFGKGLLENEKLPAIVSKYRKPIRSFELGLATGPMVRRLKRYEMNYSVGESIVDYIEREISQIRGLVDLQINDITQAEIPNEPIEILFLDVIKKPSICDFVLNNLFDKLIPGKTIVVQQDYFHPWTPWINVTMEAMNRHFEFIGRNGGSGYFLHTQPIESRDIVEFSNMAAEEKIRLMTMSIDRQDEAETNYVLAMGKVRLLADLGRLEEARPLFDHLVELKAHTPALARYRVDQAMTTYLGQAAKAAGSRPG